MTNDWFVLRTRSRHENVVESHLKEKNITCYLPKGMAGKKIKSNPGLESPLFPGYVFVKPSDQAQFRDLRYIRGSCGLVVFNSSPASLREREVENIRMMSRSGLALEVHSRFLVGRKVMVYKGPLKGLEGELIRIKNHHRLVINTFILGQAVSLEIGEDEVDRISA